MINKPHIFNLLVEIIQPASVGKEMKFLKNFMTMNEEERKLIGHDFTSFFKDCTFRGKNCLEEKYVGFDIYVIYILLVL